MRESEFQGKVVKWFKSVGAMTFNIHGHAMQASGWPDLQVYHRWWTGHLELKMNDNEPTALQASRIANLKARGTEAYVLRCKGGVVSLEDERGTVLQLMGELCSLDGRALLTKLREQRSRNDESETASSNITGMHSTLAQ